MTAVWAKNAGQVTCCGDSTTVGQAAFTGGWVSVMNTALGTANVHRSLVGPVATGGVNMFAYGATVIEDYYLAGAHPLATELAAQKSSTLILCLGFNNFRSTVGLTPAAAAAKLRTLLDQCYAATPGLTVILERILITEACDPAAWPSVDNPACVAAITAFNEGPDGYDAVITNYTALGKRISKCPSYADPVRSDCVHPIDGPTGYNLMATAATDGVVAALP